MALGENATTLVTVAASVRALEMLANICSGRWVDAKEKVAARQQYPSLSPKADEEYIAYWEASAAAWDRDGEAIMQALTQAKEK